ncbi:MAG: hypothetical protein KF729_12560 [Sandaracinaceae bacterium]|nr:hypothetical protein [Sandaracinaceae bacterium]
MPASPPRRKWLLGAAIGATAVALLGVSLHFWTADEATETPVIEGALPPPPGPAPDVTGEWRIVVLPFGAPEGEPPETGEAIARALAAALDLAPETSAAFAAPADAADAADATAPLAWPAGVALARARGATHFVVGTLDTTSGALGVRVVLHHRDGAVVRSAEAAAPRAEVLARLYDAAQALLGTRASLPSADLDVAAASSTRSLEAMTAFTRGEDALARDDFAAAADAYADAVAADPGFVFARYRRATALERSGRYTAALDEVERVLENRDRLAHADLARAEALRAAWRGEPRRARALLEIHTTEHPRDAESWRRLGDVCVRLGPVTGRPPADGRAALDRALELAPGHTDALEGLALLAADAGDLDALEALVSRFEPARRPAYALVVAIARDDEATLRALGEAEVTPALAPLLALPELRGHAYLAASPGTAPAEAAWRRAEHALAHGRPSAALEALDPTWDTLPAFVREAALALAWLPVLRVSREALAPRCALLPERATDGGDDDPHAGARPAITLFLTGACAHRLGRADEAARALDALRDDARPRPVLGAALAAQLEAWIALERGEPERALELLAAAEAPIPPWELERSALLAGVIGRAARVEALLALDRLAEALHYAQSLPHPVGASRALAAHSLHRIGEIYRRAGRDAEMRRTWDRYLALRAAPEPPFEDEVAAVRAHLAAPSPGP